MMGTGFGTVSISLVGDGYDMYSPQSYFNANWSSPSLIGIGPELTMDSWR